jgi:tRNA (cytidine/uridine-2'-O-)-methyltransferase
LTSDFSLPSAVSLFRIVLHEPEIAPNAGSIMRLCANTGCTLHLVEPFPFALDDARLRRAGLDYRERAVVRVHRSWEDFLNKERPGRVIAFTGHASTSYADISYELNDALVFGKESVGLPETVLVDQAVSETVRIPMAPNGRSLNLASAAAVAVYEGWRQLGFPGAAAPRR